MAVASVQVFSQWSLILLVFEHLPTCSLASLAVVCRCWSSFALPMIWSSVVNLSRYANLIGAETSVHGQWVGSVPSYLVTSTV
jgi:hypothetical protein